MNKQEFFFPTLLQTQWILNDAHSPREYVINHEVNLIKSVRERNLITNYIELFVI